MKRLFAVLLSLMLLVGVLGVFAAPASAAGKETILIAGSDFQVSNHKTTELEKLINTLTAYGITKVDRAFFCGDYTAQAMETDTSQYGIQVLKDAFAPLAGQKMLFVQGNHDIETTRALAAAGNNDPGNKAYGAFVINEDQYREWGNNREDTEKVAKTLRAYLEQKYAQGFKKPVFVLCHIPLHWSNRTRLDGSGTDADLIFDVLNEYGEKGMNIFYLYGHNHSGGYDDFMGGGAVYLKKGDTIEVCQGDWQGEDEAKRHHETRTLKFTYMNAGFIGYYSTNEKAADAALTMSVFRIQEDGSVIITRYDTQGVHNLKSKGVRNEEFYQKRGYHAEVNTLEYASSRKVTATDDVAVDPPVPVPTQTTSATTTVTTTTVRSKVFNKQTGTTTTSKASTTGAIQSTTAVPDTSVTTSTAAPTSTTKGHTVGKTDASGGDGIVATDDTANLSATTEEVTGTSGADGSIATDGTVDTTATTGANEGETTEESTPAATTENQSAADEDAAAASAPFPWWVWLVIVGAAILVIGTIVVVMVTVKSGS